MPTSQGQVAANSQARLFREADIQPYRQWLLSGIDRFYQEDHELLARNVTEWSLSNRLSQHLQQEWLRLKEAGTPLGGVLDAEYDRNGVAAKHLHLQAWPGIRQHARQITGRNFHAPQQQYAQDVRVDLVLHQRNSNQLNLVAIELKRDHKHLKGPDVFRDLMKLSALTRWEPLQDEDQLFRYQLGYFVFLKSQQATCAEFRSGRLVQLLRYPPEQHLQPTAQP